MIAHSSSGRNFFGLVRYLLHGRSGEEHDRVAWTVQRNLALDDPERAPALMRATAAQNHRVEQPVYHLVLAFDPSDRPSPGLMRQVSDRLLAELRLSEHQTLIVAHRDRAHAHLHIVINRVHPETGRAWDRWQDHVIAQRALRHLERGLNLREVDGRLHQLSGQRAPEPHEHESSREQQRERRRTEDDFDPGRRQTFDEAARRLFDADLPRHIGRLEFEWTRAIETDTALLDRLQRAQQRLDTASRALYNELDRAYARPLEALRRFDEVLYSQGSREAIRRLRDDPASFVELRPYARPTFLGLWHRVDDTTAREFVPEAVAAARQYASAVHGLREVLRQHEPSLTRADRDRATKAESELAAHRERAERELARLHEVRDRLPGDDILRQRARDTVRELRPRDVARLGRMFGSAVADLASTLRHRVVRDIAMGRELDLHL